MKSNHVALSNLIFSAVAAQELYKNTTGTALRLTCNLTSIVSPTFQFSSFAFTQSDTLRIATSRPSPTATSTYAAPYVSLSSLVPSLSTTSWGNWDRNATTTPTDQADPYGQAAWTSQWVWADLQNYTFTGIYSTTVSPTPVPTSELILPPADYFGPTDCYNFPEGFMFGVSGSAAQIEGAIAVEGRAPTLMEKFIADDRPKDYVTNENYFLYKQDIERLASMGVEYYSFSISWTRILPFVLPGTPVNQAGLDHYNDLIDFVLSKGMIPTITMTHFDTPLIFYADNITSVLETPTIGYGNGGYQNETFADAFINYGKILMTHFADRVPVWFTFNEPQLYSTNARSVDTVIKSHARLYHFYHDVINGTGKVGMKFNLNFGVPLNAENTSHVEAANHYNEFQVGTFANPVVLGIDYPEAFKMTAPDYIPLTAEDLEYLNGTMDFVGIDPYTATVVSPPDGGIAACAANQSNPYFPTCCIESDINEFGWNIGYRSQSYVYITPTYLRSYLNYIWNTYRHPIFITEFGFPVFGEDDKDLPGQLFDTPRSQYYLSYMSEVLKAIWEDNVNVIGALAWSFADNWEFGDYEQHFGIQTVNRTTQERNYKKSFFDLVDFVKTRMPS